MASLPKYVPRNFDLVRRDLEETVARIGKVFNPKDRRKLLRKLRELLEEADEIIESKEIDFQTEARPE
jgi:hypothetical protein